MTYSSKSADDVANEHVHTCCVSQSSVKIIGEYTVFQKTWCRTFCQLLTNFDFFTVRNCKELSAKHNILPPLENLAVLPCET